MVIRPLTLAALLATALATSGCDLLDRIEGRSPDRRSVERQAALIDPTLVDVGAGFDTPVTEPVTVEEAAAPEPTVVPCYETFRINRCVDGMAVEWVM